MVQAWRKVSRRLGLALVLGSLAGGLAGATLAPTAVVAQESGLEVAQRARALAAEGRLDEALAATQRALDLFTAEYGPNHAAVGYMLHDLAKLHYRLRRLDEALSYAGRAETIALAALGRDAPDYAAQANTLGTILLDLGRLREAEPYCVRAYEVLRAAFGPADPRTAAAARNLGIIYGELRRPNEARRYAQEVVEARRGLFGVTAPELAEAYLELARLELEAEAIDAADAAAAEARAILGTQAEPEPAALAQVDTVLAQIAIQRSDLPRAEERLRNALAALDGSEGMATANALATLAIAYGLTGKFVEAEPLLRRVLAIHRRELGEHHPAVARALHNLARAYNNLGQREEAKRLYDRALQIHAASAGEVSGQAAETRIESANLLTRMGDTGGAVQQAQRALEIFERLPERRELQRAYALATLGFAQHRAGELERAAATLERGTGLIAQIRGDTSSDLPPGLTELGEIYLKQGRLTDAERVLLHAIAIREKDDAVTPERLAKSLSALAQLRLAQGRADEALAAARRATGIVRERLDLAQGSLSAAAQGEVVGARDLVERHLVIGHALRERAGGDGGLLGEMFEAAQLPHLSATAATLAQTTAKLRPDQPELAGLVAERQDALEQWRALDRLLLDRLAAGTLAVEDERQLREHLERLAATIRTVDEAIRARFPDYADLTNPRPAAVGAVAAALEADEALLLQVTGEGGTFLFLVRPEGVSHARTELAAGDLDEAVRSLRAGLMVLPGQRFNDLPDFDVGAAHRLYRGLLAPFEAELRAVRHLIVVPDGAMRSLPFAVLLRTEPATAPGNLDYEGLRALDYIGRHFALSVVPSADSLVGLRRRVGASRASQPFLGFGDPLLGPELPDDFGAGRDEDDGPATRGATGTPTPALIWRRGVEVDLRAFRLMDPLPETRDELLALATAFGTGEPKAAVRLRGEATETAVRTAAELRDHRVLAFATHALVAGEFGGLAEPALVLTPPAVPGPADDGLLTASEVAGLHLDADWVILSACNTAAGERPGAEGLSGLARAFFHAGSRALLVTHWYVPSDAAVALTVFAARALMAEPELGRAEALRRGLARVMDGEHPDGKTYPYFAHPLFWAPFINVGEGGPGR